MSRRDHTPYYEDEGLMEIVDYSTPRRGEDLTSPNAPRQVNTTQPRDTVIVPATPAHRTTRVIDDEFFITERFDAFTLNAGEVIDILDLSGEAGEIVSIEMVTDNPYTGIYLEMDDYKNSAGAAGVTAAELLIRNKTSPAEREFYAEDMREDGKFVVRYSPSEGDPYTDKIKIQVRNDVQGTSDVFGQVKNHRLKLRNGLPSPKYISHGGGWYVKHQDFEGVPATDTHKLLRTLGPYRYECPIRNMQHIDDPTTPIGPYSPYINTAAEIKLGESGLLFTNARLVWGEPGQAITDTTGLDAPNAAQWPGDYVGDSYTPSEQQVILYTTRAEDETSTQGGGTPFNTLQLPVDTTGYVKSGDTVYFPGKVTKVQFYDAGDSQFKDEADGDAYLAGTDGAIVVTFSPGLPFKPGKVTIDSATPSAQKNCWGTVIYEGNLTPKEASSRMRIQEVVVRRKRKKTLLL